MSKQRLSIPVVLVTAILAGRTYCDAEELSPANGATQHNHPFNKSDSVSDSFSRELQAAALTIPDDIWSLIRDAGWRVDVVEYVIDAVPSLRGTAPRGWPDGWLWDNTDAVHLPASKQLIIAEKRRTKKGQIVACTRAAGVLRHEVGHAFDAISGETAFQSTMPAFEAAYQSDFDRMSEPRRQELQYYLQRSTAGRQETFAEAFGVVFGGGSDVAHRKAFEESFQQTIDCVRGIVDSNISSRKLESESTFERQAKPERAGRLRFRLR